MNASQLLAQSLNLSPQGNFNGLNGITITGIVSALITFILVIAAVVFFFMLIIGGLRWILSGGDKAQTEAARNQITAALVGLVIVFSAWAIASIVGTLFNVDIFNITLPNALNG